MSGQFPDQSTYIAKVPHAMAADVIRLTLSQHKSAPTNVGGYIAAWPGQ